jgi:hypothetical protein
MGKPPSAGGERESKQEILSLNVGLPKKVTWQDKRVTTRIFKEPVKGRAIDIKALRRAI